MTKVFLYHAFLFSNHILLRKVYTINNNKQAFSFQLARLTHLKHHLILKASMTMISSSFESLHKKLFVFPPSCQVFGQCHNTSSWGEGYPSPQAPVWTCVVQSNHSMQINVDRKFCEHGWTLLAFWAFPTLWLFNTPSNSQKVQESTKKWWQTL